MHKTIKAKVNIDVKNIDEYLKKAKKYVGILEKAKTLAKELADLDFNINIK